MEISTIKQNKNATNIKKSWTLQIINRQKEDRTEI